MAMIHLGTTERIDGPKCPQCGCRDGHTVASGTWGGMSQVRRVCKHCNRRFSAVAAPAQADPPANDTAIAYHYSKPDKCGSCGTAGRVYHTGRGVRYVKCPKCSARWKEIGRAVR